jgi:hypothetical protein
MIIMIRLHNEELSLFRAPNIARVIKARSLRWTDQVDRMK